MENKSRVGKRKRRASARVGFNATRKQPLGNVLPCDVAWRRFQHTERKRKLFAE